MPGTLDRHHRKRKPSPIEHIGNYSFRAETSQSHHHLLTAGQQQLQQTPLSQAENVNSTTLIGDYQFVDPSSESSNQSALNEVGRSGSHVPAFVPPAKQPNNSGSNTTSAAVRKLQNKNKFEIDFSIVSLGILS